MRTPTVTADPAMAAAVERNLDLVHRFLLGEHADPSRIEVVPANASVVLLPDDDPGAFEANLAMAADLTRKGRNVYLRHFSLANLPEPAPSIGPSVGDRRATFDAAGNLVASLVYGADGKWHQTNDPPPGSDVDEPATA